MCNKLCNVNFSLGTYEYIPDVTDKEEQEMYERCKERRGYFHRWTEEVDASQDLPFIKPIALVEDADTGKIHEVEYHNLRFTSDWL